MHADVAVRLPLQELAVYLDAEQLTAVLHGVALLIAATQKPVAPAAT